jgi:type IV pilus assembly protein PilY1
VTIEGYFDTSIDTAHNPAHYNMLNPNGMTPLAESLADIGWYLSSGATNLTLHPGQSNETSASRNSVFHSSYSRSSSWTTGTNPIQYSCQKSFTILVTDGRPQSDRDVSSYLQDYDGDCATSADNCGSYDEKPGESYESAGSDYLDDVAQALYEVDLRPDLSDSNGAKNNMITYAIGFADHDALTDPLLREAATQGGGQFFTAQNSAELVSALEDALSDLMHKISSASAIATNSSRVDTQTHIYQARFNSGNWSGQLLSYPLDTNGTLGNLQWDAGTLIPSYSSGNRHLYTWDSGTGAGASFPTTAQTSILGTSVADYIAGDQSNEGTGSGQFRVRSTLLGDIIDSDPAYVGVLNFGYDTLPEGQPTSAHPYADFVGTTQPARRKMLYVGANDGMLHAFDADTGVEQFAYIPNVLTNSLTQLTSQTYNQNHQFFVDGSPFVGDAYIDGDWKTVLVGTLNAGGKGVFALDVTNPDAFDASKVLWEYAPGDGDLGLTYGQAVIARTNAVNSDDGSPVWAAVFGNGYNSTNGHAELYFVNLRDGSLIRRIDTSNDAHSGCSNSQTGNGLSSPSLYASGATDGGIHKVVDYVYAGDLAGHLWRFNISDSNPANWHVSYSCNPLFTAQNASDQAQPITASLELGASPISGYGPMVYFGTGRYIAVGDNSTSGAQIQSMYGIWDNGTAVSVVTRGTSYPLVQQTFSDTTASTGAPVRTASSNTVAYTTGSDTKRGWYMDLNDTTNYPGERVVSTPLLRYDRVIFTTLAPDSAPCAYGGNSWIMELSAQTGSALTYSVFDVNNDGQFNSGDYASVSSDNSNNSEPVSGVLSGAGILQTPTVVTAGDQEYKLGSGTSGDISVTREKATSYKTGRVSWHEIVQ